MALKIEDIRLMKRYFEGVMSRANHHAENVNEIILALAGGVIWRGADIDVYHRDVLTKLLFTHRLFKFLFCLLFIINLTYIGKDFKSCDHLIYI